MTKLKDLPPDVRKLIESGQARTRGGAGLVPTTASAPRSKIQWRCHACREEFPSWAAAERHGRGNVGHRRIEVLFTQGKDNHDEIPS